MKFNKYFFDQDYSLRGTLSWGTVWFWVWFFLTILLDSSLVGMLKSILLWVWVIIFLFGVYLVKSKKTPNLDERLVLVQAKAYAYSWSIWVIALMIGSILWENNYINISLSDFWTLIIILMCWVYFWVYYYLRNKI
jgi:hypothetical protein